jgi:hypothetical protein
MEEFEAMDFYPRSMIILDGWLPVPEPGFMGPCVTMTP